ncbi:SRPBCC family protein [Ilumatobacter sp.]|uniref:SRPBCC family protein n=1 Tax=Ilumatobacter sp. TaxID=1967498 RepID=UPI003AF4848B
MTATTPMTTTIEHVVHIDAMPSTVYELWTTPEGLCAWWGVTATVDPRPGGPIRVDIDGEHVMVGEIVEADPPHRLRFTFGWEGGELAPGATEVDVTIDAVGVDISRVTLRHHGLPVEFVESHVRGWTHFVGERLAEAAR